MGFEFIKKLPTPDEIRNQYPIDAKIKALKEQMEAALGSVDSKEQLAEFWQNFLGKWRHRH